MVSRATAESLWVPAVSNYCPGVNPSQMRLMSNSQIMDTYLFILRNQPT